MQAGQDQKQVGPAHSEPTQPPKLAPASFSLPAPCNRLWSHCSVRPCRRHVPSLPLHRPTCLCRPSMASSPA